jgi:hypothetical protein
MALEEQPKGAMAMSRRPRHQHIENNQRGLRGTGPHGACSVTDRKVIKRVTSKFNRRESKLHVEEQTAPAPKPRAPTWHFITEKGFRLKLHCVPKPFLDGVFKYLAKLLNDHGHKDPEIKVRRGAKRAVLDLPGPCMENRNLHDLKIPGLIVQVPSTDVEILRAQLAGLSPRSEFGFPYYKLHGAFCCLCLTPEMRDQLLAEMDRILPEAQAIASAENAKINATWAVGMRQGVLYQAHPRPTGKSGGDA